jgi:uroporphyrinogen-III decarboxylase
MNTDRLLEERKKRIEKAIALEKPDRIPVILSYALWAAQVARIPYRDFCLSRKKAAAAQIEAYALCGNADGLDYLGFHVYGLCHLWMSKVKVPGIDLPPDTPYQMDEKELMKIEDYDVILNRGWPEFYSSYMQDRVFHNVAPENRPDRQPLLDLKELCEPLGIPLLVGGGILTTPYDKLCGARSMVNFMRDLFVIPDKVKSVMDLMLPHLMENLKSVKSGGYGGAWVGGWRTASAMVSPRLWDRFVWPYFRQLVYETVESGVVAVLHLDSDWTRDLARFRELPKGRCILSTDGATNLLKAKEILGDHLCLMGDVPATKLCLGTPEEVYEYSRTLIKELGPEGFILHSGCDIPVNAKLENVRAMVSAATGE